jgi:putative colanic acid biosysnthesis UDP-glucose lipid carrier transferase
MQSAYTKMNQTRLYKQETGTEEYALYSDANLYSLIRKKMLNPGNSKVISILPVWPLNKPLNRVLKRGADIIISLLSIVFILSWLTPVLAVIIKLTSRGPVFFFQQRNMRHGRIFTCIKFRTMMVNEEADILPAAENDRRITWVGGFLRNHYIDELPQFINVLLGQMSVIGPRPHMLADNLHFAESIGYYNERHRAKPGITGLAQVMGFTGNTKNFQDLTSRINTDIYYLRHWSAKMDCIILFRTLLKIFGC